jgi:hypothetical protein
MKDYGKTLLRHLVDYKRARLGIKLSGTYNYRGRDVVRPQILPRELRWLNILEGFRAEIHEYVRSHKSIILHKYFHHLNSSQALALNLFLPFFESDSATSAALLAALGLNGDVRGWCCEMVVDAKEETQVDVAWQNSSGSWTYCEVKLSEREFGHATGIEKHHHKLLNTYGPGLRDHCTAEMLESKNFFEHYQILRNVWLASRDQTSRVIFLLPRENEGIWKRLNLVLASLKPSLRSRIFVAELESTLTTLAGNTSLSPALQWHSHCLREKYVPIAEVV